MTYNFDRVELKNDNGQIQVILLKELQQERNLTYLFISHNMSVIRYMCQRVAVMFKGELVEVGDTKEIFENPEHPYTQKLLSSVLTIQNDISTEIILK